jgi:hypothetical protein
MKRILSLRLSTALLIFALAVTPALAQSGVSNFTNIKSSGYTVAGSYLESTTYTKVGTFERLTPGTTVVVTTDGTITPVASYQPLSSSGNVQTASITAGTAGDVLYMINTSNTTITLTDTGTLKLGGNRALGQYDTLTLVSDGTNWIERSYTNN